MLKLGVILLCVFQIFQTNAQIALCTAKKSQNACICKRIPNEEHTSIVTEADCSRISLQHFPGANQFPNDLNFLDLSHNQLEQLDGYEKFLSETLETLDLSYNVISFITEDFFTHVPNLKKLILSHNNITSLDSDTLFENCRKLTYLDLSFNNIKTLQVNIFLPLSKLDFLDLSYNDLMLGLRLSQSPLVTNLGLNPNVSVLKLDNLGMKDLHNLYFANYTNLIYLSLADNHFEEIPRVPHTLEYLDLSGSNISTIQVKFLNYPSLKTLKLNRLWQLENIHHYAFYNLQSLEELSIRNCHNLKEFTELAFGLLSKNTNLTLKKLYLSGNALQSLNSTYKYLFESLDVIDLTDNPWKCDCELLWLQEVNNLYRSENIKCSYPYRVNSKSLIDLTAEDLRSCHPEKYGKKSHRIAITILVLLIIALVALVIYLFYYSPYWYNGLSRLGPQSPYSPERIEEIH